MRTDCILADRYPLNEGRGNNCGNTCAQGNVRDDVHRQYRSTKAGVMTPAMPGLPKRSRTAPWQRSTKAGVMTPAMRRPRTVERVLELDDAQRRPG